MYRFGVGAASDRCSDGPVSQLPADGAGRPRTSTPERHRHPGPSQHLRLLLRRKYVTLISVELISWAYPLININSCLQAITKDISTPADIAPSALETIVGAYFIVLWTIQVHWLITSISLIICCSVFYRTVRRVVCILIVNFRLLRDTVQPHSVIVAVREKGPIQM